MSANDWRDEIEPLVGALQSAVVFVTVSGLVLMAVIIFKVQADGVPAGNGDLPLMTYFSIGHAGLAVVARVVVLGIFTSRARKRIADGTWQVPGSSPEPAPNPWVELVERLGDRGRLSIVFHIRTSIGVVFLGAAAVYLLIHYLTEPSPLILGTAIVMIVGAALHFPTQSGAADWIEDQLAAVEQLRQVG